MCALLFFFTLIAGMLARSQYSEGPATGHLDTGFSRFPCAYKQTLRRFPTFQVATTCFSCSPPDLNSVVTNFMFFIHVKQPLPPDDNPIAVTKYTIYIINIRDYHRIKFMYLLNDICRVFDTYSLESHTASRTVSNRTYTGRNTKAHSPNRTTN